MSHVTIIGAGIVGACIARFLQRAGHDVTILDRNEPGTGCSFGNSGAILTLEASTQLPGPRLLRQIPRMLLDRDAVLIFRAGHMFRMMPWMLSFLRGCTALQQRRTAQAMATLLSGTTSAYDDLVAGTAADQLIRRNGTLGLSSSNEWFAADQWRRDLNASFGAEMQELGPTEIQKMEPSLSSDVCRAMFYPNAYNTPDPALLTKTILDDTVSDGGRFLKQEVTKVRVENGRPTSVLTDSSELSVDRLVIAAGAYSHRVTRMLGIRVLLETERGYHVEVDGIDTTLKRTVLHGEHAYAMNPTKHGVRIAGTVEFAGLDAPPDYDRARTIWRRGHTVLRELHDISPQKMKFWMGRRPTLPDYRPIIGSAPGIDNCWFAFGHQHLGLTLAARTGQVLVNLVEKRDPGLDLAPFSASRF